MAVRLIALDLDGTALREHREMTERTREAILAALDAGILVVPSTGRSYRDIPGEVRNIPGDSVFSDLQRSPGCWKEIRKRQQRLCHPVSIRI